MYGFRFADCVALVAAEGCGASRLASDGVRWTVRPCSLLHTGHGRALDLLLRAIRSPLEVRGRCSTEVE